MYKRRVTQAAIHQLAHSIKSIRQRNQRRLAARPRLEKHWRSQWHPGVKSPMPP